MKVTGTPAAGDVVERARHDRRGTLVFSIGTGCCESTAPFLYEDYWPGPDAEVVGEVAGVPVYASAYLRDLYPGDDGLVVDVAMGCAESMSIETEYGCRFVLRDPSGTVIGGEEGVEVAACPNPPSAVEPGISALRDRGPRELPEALRGLRMR